MSKGLATTLRVLIAQGHIAHSTVSTRQRKALEPLFDAGVLEKKRQGAGWRVKVVNAGAVQKFADQRFPRGLSFDTTPGDLPRATSVHQRRNAKRATRAAAEVVLLRGLPGTELIGPETLPVGQHTTAYGVASVLLTDDPHWGYTGSIAVVENLEAFLHFEQLGVDARVACYSAGRLSGRVMAWLASPYMESATYLHCGDYDPVGVQEYLRLKECCPGRASLYVPPNLEALVRQYGRKKLIRDSPSVFKRLRSSTDPAVQRLVDIMERTGLGLEQEVLLGEARREP